MGKYSIEDIRELLESNKKLLAEGLKDSLAANYKSGRLGETEIVEQFERKVEEVVKKLKEYESDNISKNLKTNCPINRLYGVYGDRDL